MELEKKESVTPAIRLSRNHQFLILCLFPCYFFIVGFFASPPDEIIEGIITILREPDFLITDYIQLGGIGAAFINASLLTLTSIAILYCLKIELTGAAVTSIFLMMGFSLFGKNIINIWSILLGVILYACFHRQHPSKYIYVGFYGTSLSPIITEIIYIQHFPAPLALIFSIFVGIVMGFCLPPLATHLFYAHRGFSLYNVGFASGLIATIVVSVFKAFGLDVESREICSSGNNTLFMIIMFGFFAILLIIGMITERSRLVLKKYTDILKHPGLAGTDYFAEEGLGASLINMAVNGAFATLFVIIAGAQLNGPTLGGIFTIVGFSATGKHLRNIAPIMFGVWLSTLPASWHITDPSVILAALFSTTLAPIAGKYGIIFGIAAGFLHACLALNIGVINNGMNLYNNGFAGGLIATFLVPVINSFEDRRARAKEDVF